MPQETNWKDLPLPRRIWWPWDQPAGRVGFERRFAVGRPAKGILYVSSSGPYTAWLDEARLAVPAAALPAWRSMHAIPVDLAVGEHRLSMEAEPGRHGQPFLLACLDWEQAGKPARIETSSEWQMASEPEDGWQHAIRREGWRPAWAFDGVWSEPWGMPCNAPQDFCRLSTGWQAVEAEPLRQGTAFFQGLQAVGASVSLLSDGAVEFSPAKPHAFQPPRLENTRPKLEWYRNREAHSLVLKAWLDMFELRAPHIVLDAGRETFGRLILRLRSGGPALLAVSTGESLEDARRYGRWATDVIELKDGETFATTPTGLRFVKVTGLRAGGPDGKAVLEPVVVEQIRYPVEERGRFECSDPRLNEIWALSKRTVHLCMQNEMWDGIKRDQLPWMGDLYTEALAIYHIFGDGRLCRRTLEVLAEVGPAPARPLEKQAYPGLAAIWRSLGGSHPGAGSGAAGNGDINGIPTYTLWWVLGLADYVLYTGDLGLIEAVASELKATLDHIASWTGKDGRWRFRGGWDFIDWSPVPAVERETYCHLLATRALEQGADLLERIGQAAGGLHLARERMAVAARKAWCPDGKFAFGASHHANAMAIRSGLLSQQERAALFAQTLAPDPPLSMTYWHRYLDLEAASLAGQVLWGLDYIRRHWGRAVDVGATALWEAFDPAWLGPDPHGVSMVGTEFARYGGYETSLCHGWSAGPAIWLHTSILGVRPAAHGFSTAVFAPHLGDLEWAEGVIPTPHGEIRVRLRKRVGEKPSAELEVPNHIQIQVMPEMEAEWDFTVKNIVGHG